MQGSGFSCKDWELEFGEGIQSRVILLFLFFPLPLSEVVWYVNFLAIRKFKTVASSPCTLELVIPCLFLSWIRNSYVKLTYPECFYLQHNTVQKGQSPYHILLSSIYSLLKSLGEDGNRFYDIFRTTVPDISI